MKLILSFQVMLTSRTLDLGWKKILSSSTNNLYMANVSQCGAAFLVLESLDHIIFQLPMEQLLQWYLSDKEMIRYFLAPKLRNLGFDGQTSFQQDGATAHSACASMSFLKDLFLDHLISWSGDVPWPARSLDLTAPDFFLWRYLKSTAYRTRPRTIQDLWKQIEQELARITLETFRKMMQNIAVRVCQGIHENGGHFKGVIFKIKEL